MPEYAGAPGACACRFFQLAASPLALDLVGAATTVLRHPGIGMQARDRILLHAPGTLNMRLTSPSSRMISAMISGSDMRPQLTARPLRRLQAHPLRIYRLGDTRSARRRFRRQRRVRKEKATLRWLLLLQLGGDGGIRTHDTGISRMHP